MGSDESDSFPTDSEEDVIGYEHRLSRIAQAVHNHEPIMVVFVGQFEGYQGINAQCEFRLDYIGEAPPTMKDFFEFNWGKLRDTAALYGADSVPGSLTWTRNQITNEDLLVSSYRFGKGLKVRYQHKELGGLPMDKWPATFVTDLHNGLSIAFPAVARLPDAVLMPMFVNLTAPWDGNNRHSEIHGRFISRNNHGANLRQGRFTYRRPQNSLEMLIHTHLIRESRTTPPRLQIPLKSRVIQTFPAR
jgi:hypothetical protein